MDYDNSHKPRGWLRFLIIVLVYVGPFTGFIQLYGETNDSELPPGLAAMPEWQVFTAVSWIGFGIQAALSILAGYRLDHVFNPSAPRFVIGFLWFGGVGLTFLYAVVSGEILGMNMFEEPAATGTIGSILSWAFWATVWTIYLLKSKQVHRLYHS